MPVGNQQVRAVKIQVVRKRSLRHLETRVKAPRSHLCGHRNPATCGNHRPLYGTKSDPSHGSAVRSTQDHYTRRSFRDPAGPISNRKSQIGEFCTHLEARHPNSCSPSDPARAGLDWPELSVRASASRCDSDVLTSASSACLTRSGYPRPDRMAQLNHNAFDDFA